MLSSRVLHAVVETVKQQLATKGNDPMRPNIMTSDRGLQPNMAAVLYVKRDTMTPKAFRLAWMVPGESCYCYAEGECSAKLFRFAWQAIAYGRRTYGETAKRWPRS